MTIAKTAAFEEFLLEIGDGGSPEVFARKCGLTQKSAALNASTASSEVPDCDDESEPSIVFNGVKSVSEEISGSGIFDAPDYAFWRAWMLSGDIKNVKVTIAKASADGGGYWVTPFVLTSFKNAVSKGEQMTADITLMSSGALGTFTASDEVLP